MVKLTIEDMDAEDDDDPILRNSVIPLTNASARGLSLLIELAKEHVEFDHATEGVEHNSPQWLEMVANWDAQKEAWYREHHLANKECERRPWAFSCSDAT